MASTAPRSSSPAPSANPRSPEWRAQQTQSARVASLASHHAHTSSADLRAEVFAPSGADVGSAYAFNAATGMLENPGGSSGAVETTSRFVESGGPGGFRRVQDDAAGASFFLSRRAAAAASAATRGSRDGSMRAVAVAVQSTVTCCGLFSQGLLGGFAALNLFMTYFLDAANLSTVNAESGFLRYYSPIAVTCQRAFITLSALALLASVDKYSKDSLGGFMLQGFTMQKIDALAVLSFFTCFLLSVVSVPFEDTLYFADARVPEWWRSEPASSDFVDRLRSYHGVNAARCIFGIIGWFCVCYTATPGVLDVVARAEALTREAQDPRWRKAPTGSTPASGAPAPAAGRRPRAPGPDGVGGGGYAGAGVGTGRHATGGASGGLAQRQLYLGR